MFPSLSHLPGSFGELWSGGVQQHRNGARIKVGHHQIQPAVAIQVPHNYVGGTDARIELLCRFEGSVADAQQHRNGGGSLRTGPKSATARSSVPSPFK